MRRTVLLIHFQQSVSGVNARDGVVWSKVFNRTHNDDQHNQRHIAKCSLPLAWA